MCGGGGGGSPPPPPSPMEEAEAQLLLMRAEAEQRAQQAAQQRALAKQDEQERINRFNQQLDVGYNNALQYARGSALDYGLNPEDFMPIIERELDFIRGTASPYYTADPTNLFSDAAVDNIFNTQQSIMRRDYANAFDDFASQGFAREMLPGTVDDNIIDQIISEQMQTAQQQLQQQLSSGQLTQPAYDFAQDLLDTQEMAARGRLNELGGGLIADARGGLRDLVNEGRTAARGFELGQNFDPYGYQSRIQGRVSDFTSGLQGQFYNTLGDESLFDVERIIARAGGFQGAQNTPNNQTLQPGVPQGNDNPVLNPTGGDLGGGFGQPTGSNPTSPVDVTSGVGGKDANPLLAAMADKSRTDKNPRRGLGTRGVF